MEIKDCKITVNINKNRMILLNNNTLMRSSVWACFLKEGKCYPESLQTRKNLRPKHSKVINYLVIVLDKKPGGPPAKDDKSKKSGEEAVVTPEEKERIEREAREKEDK